MLLTITDTQDILFLVLSFASVCVTFFLCWTLYEIARLMRQGNAVVRDTREKIDRVEQTFLHIAEKMGSVSQYLGLIATAGRELFVWMRKRETQEEEAENAAEEISGPVELSKRKRKN